MPLPGIHLVRAKPIAAHLFRISLSFSASFSPQLPGSVIEVYGLFIYQPYLIRGCLIQQRKALFCQGVELGVVYLSINSGNSGDFGLTGGFDLQWHLCSMLRRCVSFCHIIITSKANINNAFVGGRAKSHVQPTINMQPIIIQYVNSFIIVPFLRSCTALLSTKEMEGRFLSPYIAYRMLPNTWSKSVDSIGCRLNTL